MADQSHQKATFYQYRLLKKITLPRWMWTTYLLLPCAAVASQMVILSWDSFIFFLLSGMLIFWIQFVIGRSVLHLTGSLSSRKWRFSLQAPWIGYMPEQHVSSFRFIKVQWHTGWMGCVLIALMAFWSPLSFTISAYFWHLWLVGPRYYAWYRLTRQYKDGMLKFGPDDVSYYSQ
ncbi:hypothetical protein ACH6EH_17865 [Paenibacillus sp. JSM ZJ436]|uniref:hypothetical protein n=1 Tax=Paenibacillus sp. JSM ZJ436 TaxID=3376190 RepID=UPI0037AA3E27